MRARFDQFTKGIFREALTPAGTVRTQEEIAAEAQAIDTRFEPDPARAHALEDLGCLGQMARVPSLFEAYHGTVDLPEFRSCVRKQLTLDHLESSRARRKKLPVPLFPHLWVLSAGRPERVLRGTRDTLLLRLMGADAVLDEAVAELAQLPEDAREREVTVTSLVAFRKKISHDPTDEERAFLMSTEPLYDQWEKQVKKEGRKEGREEGRRAMLLDLLRTRFGALPKATVVRVNAATSVQLSRWAKRVLSAPALEDVFRQP